MVIVITGGSSGIGLETARLFSNCPDNIVYVLNRREIKENNIHWIKCDLSDVASIKSAIELITKKHKIINLLILQQLLYLIFSSLCEFFVIFSTLLLTVLIIDV